MGSIEVEVYAELRPTENEYKVKRAVLNIVDLPEVKVIEVEGTRYVYGRATGLSALGKFKELINREGIGDTARDLFMRSITGDTIVINVNKQAAYVGVLSFAMGEVESPLGPITIKIKSPNPEQVVNWLTS